MQLKEKIQDMERNLSIERTKLRQIEIELKKYEQEYKDVRGNFGLKEKLFPNWLGNPSLINKADNLESQIRFLSTESEKSKDSEYKINCNINLYVRNYLLDNDPNFKKLIHAHKRICEFKDEVSGYLWDVRAAIDLVQNEDDDIYFLRETTQNYNRELWDYNLFVKINPEIVLSYNGNEYKIELEQIPEDSEHIQLFSVPNLVVLERNLVRLEKRLIPVQAILNIQYNRISPISLDYVEKTRIKLVSN